WLPSEWTWYRAQKVPHTAPCCGILGGTNLAFLHYYAERAMAFLTHPCNQAAFARMTEKIKDMVLIEQWFLSACLMYHRGHRDSPFFGIEAEYLLESFTEALNPDRTTALGYTHLIASAKRDEFVERRLLTR